MKRNRVLSLFLVLAIAVTLSVSVTADNVATPAQLRLGDTTGDGNIDAADALQILQFAVGKRTAFTAEKTNDPAPEPIESKPTPTDLIDSEPPTVVPEPVESQPQIIAEPLEIGALFHSFEEFEAWFVTDQVEERVKPEVLARWRRDGTTFYYRPVGMESYDDLRLVQIEVNSYSVMYTYALKDEQVNGSNNLMISYQFDSGFADSSMRSLALTGVERGSWKKTETGAGNDCYYSTPHTNGSYQMCLMYNNKPIMLNAWYGTASRVLPEDLIPHLAVETVTLPLK